MTHPRKIKELSSLAQTCFEKIVGEPPNHNFKFHTPEEIEYTFGILSTMVMGYLKEVSQEDFDLIEEKRAESKANTELKKNIAAMLIPKYRFDPNTEKLIEETLSELVEEVNSIVLKNVKGNCPQCGSLLKNNFCYVCTLNVGDNKND